MERPCLKPDYRCFLILDLQTFLLIWTFSDPWPPWALLVSQAHAKSVMDKLVHWVRVDPSGLGRPQLSGDRPVNGMAVPMMLLCLVEQLSEGRAGEAEKYSELGSWCVQQILQHIQVTEKATAWLVWCPLVTGIMFYSFLNGQEIVLFCFPSEIGFLRYRSRNGVPKGVKMPRLH